MGLGQRRRRLAVRPTLDHPGPIARTVGDLKLIMNAIDTSGDPSIVTLPGNSWIDALDLDATAAAQDRPIPPTLVRPRCFFDRRADPVMLDLFERALDVLAKAGADVVDLDDGAIDFEGIITRHRTIMAAEAAAGHEQRFSEQRPQYASHICGLVLEGLATPVTEYVRCLWRHSTEPAIDCVLVTPATIGPAPDTSTTGNPCFNTPFSYLGWPSISFPMSLAADGLPVALQLVKSGQSEENLFAVASWCESVIRRSRPTGSP